MTASGGGTRQGIAGLERLDDAARDVIDKAMTLAIALSAPSVDLAAILWALAKREGVAAQALAAVGVTSDDLRVEPGTPDKTVKLSLELSPRAEIALDNAL